MTATVKERSGLEIITELLTLTRQMAEKKDDADFLIESVDKRQQLMDEYDRAITATSYAQSAMANDKSQTVLMVKEIIELDKKINAALFSLREGAKLDVSNSNAQKRVLSYTNVGIPSSGSYMDYKK